MKDITIKEVIEHAFEEYVTYHGMDSGDLEKDDLANITEFVNDDLHAYAWEIICEIYRRCKQ